MTISVTSELLADAVVSCVEDMKIHLLQEVDRLAEEFQRNLVHRLSDQKERLSQRGRAAARTSHDGMPGIDELQAEHASEAAAAGVEEMAARDERALARAPSQVFSQGSAAVTEVSATSASTAPVFNQSAKERQLEKQRSAENASKFGIPALPLESLHGNVESEITPKNGNPNISDITPKNGNPNVSPPQLLEPPESQEKQFESQERQLLAVEVSNPMADEEQTDIQKKESEVHFEENEAFAEDEDGVIKPRSSQLWLTAGTSTSLGAAGFPCLRSIVRSKIFESFFSVIIVLNCVTMGLEAEQQVKGPASDTSYYFLLVCEHVFTGLFSCELIMRLLVYGWRAFIPTSGDRWWNFMDAFLVIFTGVLFSWVLPLLSMLFGFNSDNSVMRTLTTLRAARLLRLVRVVQRVPQFREAWLLLRGLTDSMRTLFWTCAVIMFITYIFAVFGLVLITKELWERRESATDEKDRIELTELMDYVGGLDLLMYTLIQLLTMDSWNGIVRRLVDQIGWCWAYFYAYIAVAVFVLMNLVTAIIVENAVTNSRQDEDQVIKQREKAKLEELKGLEHLFVLMDSDGSGTLSWDEFKAAFDDPEMTRKWKLLDFDPDECKELFGLLDDGDGEIETSEFFEGLAQMKGVAQSKDVFRLRKCLDEVKELVESLGPGSEKEVLEKEGGEPNAEGEAVEAKSNAKDEILVKLPQEVVQEEKCTTVFKEASVQTKVSPKIAKKAIPSYHSEVDATLAMFKAPMPPLEAEMPIVVPTCPSQTNPGQKMRM